MNAAKPSSCFLMMSLVGLIGQFAIDDFFVGESDEDLQFAEHDGVDETTSFCLR